MILERVGLMQDRTTYRWHLHGEVPFTGYAVDHVIDIDHRIMDTHGPQREFYEVARSIDAVKDQAKECGFDVDWSGVDAKLEEERAHALTP